MLMLFLAADSWILLITSTAVLEICKGLTISPGYLSCTSGWANSSFHPILFSSLITRHFLIRSLVFSPILPLYGKDRGLLRILNLQESIFLQTQGPYPNTISQSMMPRLQISHLAVQACSLRICGAMYRGVPQTRSSLWMQFMSALQENPKSAILQCQPRVRMFYGFTSRWMYPKFISYLKPRMICVNTQMDYYSLSLPLLALSFLRRSLQHSSIAKQVDWLSMNESYRQTIQSLLRFFMSQISIPSPCLKFLSLKFAMSIYLMATYQSDSLRFTLQTMENDPEPILTRSFQWQRSRNVGSIINTLSTKQVAQQQGDKYYFLYLSTPGYLDARLPELRQVQQYRQQLSRYMRVSLLDKQNHSHTKPRISHFIQPVRMLQRSERKVLQQLFPQPHNLSIADEHAPVMKNTISQSALSTRKQCLSRVSEVVIEAGRMAGLERQLQQTRAIMRLEETNKERKIEVLSERVHTLQQELEVTQVQTRRYQERCEVADRGLYELERRLIEKEVEVAAGFEHRIMQLEMELHQREKELIASSTDNSKSKYDMHHDIMLAREQIEKQRQMLAEKDFRLMDLQTKSTIQRAELQSRLQSLTVALSHNQHVISELQSQLSQCTAPSQLTSQISTLTLQLKSKQESLKILKDHLNRLSNVESENDELKRNEKKLVRRYEQLEKQMVERNEKVNEIVLGYEEEATRMRQKVGELEKENGELKGEVGRCVRELEEREKAREHTSLAINLQTSRRQVELTVKNMQQLRERHCYEMNIKDEKIALLDRQLVERDCQINRLVGLIKFNNQQTNVQIVTVQSKKVKQLETQLINLNQITQSSKANILAAEKITASLKIELELKNQQIIQLNKIIQSQSISLNQLKKTTSDNQILIQLKNSELSQISNQCKRLQNIVTETQVIRMEEEEFKKDLMSKFAGTLTASENTSASVKQSLLLKISELQSTKGLLSELTLTNRLLRQSNAKYVLEVQTLNHRVEQLLANQRLNQELIIKIQEQSKASRQRLQQTMSQEYEILYQKYIKYRRILQKDRDRKQLQRAIIKDSNEFNEQIVEKCKQIIK